MPSSTAAVADRRRSVAAAALLLLITTGCTAASEPPARSDPTDAATDSQNADPAAAGNSLNADPAAVAAIRRTIDAINATAAGDVAVQQAVLARLVDPARAAEQAACAPATITIRIDAVVDRLSPRDPAGSSGVGYRVPALLEVYTGAVRTGTDLTGLEITLTDDVAHPAPLCLR